MWLAFDPSTNIFTQQLVGRSYLISGLSLDSDVLRFVLYQELHVSSSLVNDSNFGDPMNAAVGKHLAAAFGTFSSNTPFPI